MWKRGGGKMENPIKAFSHQKIHAQYGRIKAVNKMKL
jgi:hypothetical protein